MEVKERDKQITGESKDLNKVKPVSLKYCVNQEWLQSMIELDFNDNVQSYEDLTEKLLRAYLNEKAQ